MTEIQIDQRRADGSLRHLLHLDSLSRAELERLLNKAQSFVRPLGSPPPTSNTGRFRWLCALPSLMPPP